MANYVVSRAKSATLVGAGIDQVEVQAMWPAITVVNRAAAGGGTIWAVTGQRGIIPANPTVAGDDIDPIMPGERITLSSPGAGAGSMFVKVIGNGQDYTVTGTSGTFNKRI